MAVEPAGGARQTQPGVCAGLPAQALIEDELGHGRWGLIPVGHRLGRRIPQRGATGAGHFGWGGRLAQMPKDGFHRQGGRHEGDEAHLGPAQPTAQGQDLVRGVPAAPPTDSAPASARARARHRRGWAGAGLAGEPAR